MKKVRQVTILLACLFVGSVLGGSIELAGEGFIPEPNQEITVQIQTDTPLFCMGLIITVTGDANITGAMSTADCNIYGWDPDWPTDPYIDPEGWLYVSGVSWEGQAEGVVGYFKFLYNSGEVSVSITEGDTYDANCEPVPFSDKTLVFGEPDPNDFSQSENSFASSAAIEESISVAEDINSSAEVNDINLPSAALAVNNDPRQQKNLKQYALGIDGNNILSATEYRQAQSLEANEMTLSGFDEMTTMGIESIIEVTSDITSNQIWTAGNTYHVATDINIQALLVIEPGTVIKFGPNGTLWVNNGGTLISCGTPNSLITYTADASTSSYQYYYCPVYVESTASPATKITYSIVKYAYVGLMINNNQLDSPVENNYLIHNSFGIVEYGTHLTDIANNLIYNSYNCGINVSMKSDAGLADANSQIRIENNTCDYYQDYGIVVFGADNIEDSPVVEVYNNIVSGSYEIGLGIDGYAYWVVSNTGYYDNAENTNADEDFPVYATSNPYVNGSGDPNRCYLNQTCPFINAGLGYIEQTHLIGTTTDVNSLPDSNFIDIGFHHPDWDFSNAGDGNTLGADYDSNFKVDFQDFVILANGWQNTYDINDLSAMANEWLCTISGHPPIAISVNGDVNNLSGEVGVSVADCSYSTSQVYIFMDGQLMGETDYNEDEGSPGVTINTPSYRNGSHSLKGVVIDHDNLITLSENLAVDFNNPLQCLSINDTYEPNQSLRLLGISATDNNLMVKLSKWDGGLVWSQETSGDLDINIPGNVLAGQIYDLSIEQEIAGLCLMDSGTSWDTIYQRAITAIYDANKSYKFAIILPNAYYWESLSLFNSADCRKDAVAGIVNGCETMGIEYIILYKDQCTWENFAKVLSKPTVFYAYVVSRGGIGLYNSTSQRRFFRLSNGGYVVSYLDPAEPLGGGWDNNPNVYSMADLGFGGTNKFKIVWIDVCYNGYGNYLGANDMARAWMDLSEVPILDKLYVSWNTAINTSNDSCYGQWSAFFWGNEDGFGLYGANSYYQAFTRAQIELDCVGNDLMQNSILGTIGDTSIKFTGNRYDY